MGEQTESVNSLKRSTRMQVRELHRHGKQGTRLAWEKSAPTCLMQYAAAASRLRTREALDALIEFAGELRKAEVVAKPEAVPTHKPEAEESAPKARGRGKSAGAASGE